MFLHDFRILLPPYRDTQQRALEWLAAAHGQAELTRRSPLPEDEQAILLRRLRRIVLRFGSASDRIQFRSSALDEFTHTDWEKMRIFPLQAQPSGAGSAERARFYDEFVGNAFERFYADDESGPPVLIHVTCTGYASPSGAQRLVARRGWGGSTEVLHAYHMGCYASLPALRIAGGLLAAGKPSVDIVHTELCTLHLDPAQHSPEQLMVQSLFADGLVRYSLAARAPAAGLQVLATHEEIVPGSESDMTWISADHGMQMSISRDVPQRIQAALPAFFAKLAGAAACGPEALRERAIFAVHPGGPRIIDQVRAALALREEQVELSNAILAEHGNMSSATLPYLWSTALDSSALAAGTHVVSLAFGPGLTLSGALLRVHRAS